MGPREEYETRKTAEKARRKQEAEAQERITRENDAARRESELRRLWFFRHPDKLVRYTGWLQLYTAILSVATAALVGATIYSAIILLSTDEKIGRQAEIAEGQLKIAEGQLNVIQGQLEESKKTYVLLKEQIEALKIQVATEGPKMRLEDNAIFKVVPPLEATLEGPNRIPDKQLPSAVVVGIMIQNAGKAPTDVSGYGIGWTIGSSPSPTPVYVYQWNEVIFLKADSPADRENAHRWRYLWQSPIRITEQQQKDIANEQAKLWVYGYVCYQNPLGPVVHRFGGKWIGSPSTSVRGFIGDTSLPAAYNGDSQEACPHQ